MSVRSSIWLRRTGVVPWIIVGCGHDPGTIEVSSGKRPPAISRRLLLWKVAGGG